MRLRFLLATSLLLVGARAANVPQIKPIDQGIRIEFSTGTLELRAVADNAVRVRFGPQLAPARPSLVFVPQATAPKFDVIDRPGSPTVRLQANGIAVELQRATGALTFFDSAGHRLVGERIERRRVSATTLRGQPTYAIEAGFDSPADERLFGTGQFQDGYLNVRNLPRRLTQVNTQIAIPMLISNRGYGLLWHNLGLTDLNPADQPIELTPSTGETAAESVEVTTTSGTKRESRHTSEYAGTFSVSSGGTFAFLLDVGQKMGRGWDVSIDGKPALAYHNLWVPPTASWLSELKAGEHTVRVRSAKGDHPTLNFRPAADETVLRSPVAEALDYVVFAGSADEVIASYRKLTGPAPLLPLWAFGYIHCRERFRSQAELLATAEEFRRRRLPIDVVVQDWQYWGKFGWGEPQFDPAQYPDPAGMIRTLHDAHLRLMVSVWSKVDHKTPLGKKLAERSLYVPGTDWVDYFNPEATALYWDTLRHNLYSAGVDCWWQDATEPENDDLVGRETAVGPGETVRNVYPLYATSTVYQGQRRVAPDRRALILTRSAFLGEQRNAAVTWSGDIGNDWDTLRRQVSAGLDYSVTGLPWWTVDGGGFFRPGTGQYTDPAYHERFLRWFQFVTFCPLQRVHGYQTNTEFWQYGDAVENAAKRYLDLRYRLLPYTYSSAARVALAGSTLMRPLVMDFPHDATALDERTEYLFGPSILVAPVLAPSVTHWPVYLPETKAGWYNFWTGELSRAGQRIEVAAPLSVIPLHLRAGSILPLGPVLQYTSESPADPIELRVYPGADGDFTLYEDDGTTAGYERGEQATIALHWSDKTSTLTLGARVGAFPGMLEHRTFRIVRVSPNHGVGIEPTEQVDASVSYEGAPKTVKLAPAEVR
jgi:alpha-D-xyloside xylohydrolase